MERQVSIHQGDPSSEHFFSTLPPVRLAACGSVGDADSAFRLQSEMLRDGVAIDKQSATSLIDACSQELLTTSGNQRRQRLVLLERAGGIRSLVGVFPSVQ